MRFNQNEKKAVERLLAVAKHNRKIALLLLNAYHSDFLCDVRSLLREAWRSDDPLREDIANVFNLMTRGVEPNEIAGDVALEGLIKIWNVKRSDTQ